MKKKILVVLGIVVVIIVIFLVIFLGDKPLKLDDPQVTELYSYLGEVDIYHCGGLNSYTGEEVKYDTLSDENKLCMAYYKLDNKQIKTDSHEVTAKNDNDIEICEIGEGIRLAAEEGENSCEYQIISSTDLKEAYSAIYGKELPDDSSFYINGTEACYLNGEEYYCGEAETFVYSLTPEATIYRLMNKASEKLNEDIVITDYYLRISDNKCYGSNDSEDEISACSEALENDSVEINEEFVQKYGTLYKHTFKKNNDDNYYWYSSNLK